MSREFELAEFAGEVNPGTVWQKIQSMKKYLPLIPIGLVSLSSAACNFSDIADTGPKVFWGIVGGVAAAKIGGILDISKETDGRDIILKGLGTLAISGVTVWANVNLVPSIAAPMMVGIATLVRITHPVRESMGEIGPKDK